MSNLKPQDVPPSDNHAVAVEPSTARRLGPVAQITAIGLIVYCHFALGGAIYLAAKGLEIPDLLKLTAGVAVGSLGGLITK